MHRLLLCTVTLMACGPVLTNGFSMFPWFIDPTDGNIDLPLGSLVGSFSRHLPFYAAGPAAVWSGAVPYYADGACRGSGHDNGNNPTDARKNVIAEGRLSEGHDTDMRTTWHSCETTRVRRRSDGSTRTTVDKAHVDHEGRRRNVRERRVTFPPAAGRSDFVLRVTATDDHDEDPQVFLEGAATRGAFEKAWAGAEPEGTPSTLGHGDADKQDAPVQEQQRESSCFEAFAPDYPQCRHYRAHGYSCVGPYCAAIDPSGTPDSCARRAPEGWELDEESGRCVPPTANMHDSDITSNGGRSPVVDDTPAQTNTRDVGPSRSRQNDNDGQGPGHSGGHSGERHRTSPKEGDASGGHATDRTTTNTPGAIVLHFKEQKANALVALPDDAASSPGGHRKTSRGDGFAVHGKTKPVTHGGARRPNQQQQPQQQQQQQHAVSHSTRGVGAQAPERGRRATAGDRQRPAAAASASRSAAPPGISNDGHAQQVSDLQKAIEAQAQALKALQRQLNAMASSTAGA